LVLGLSFLMGGAKYSTQKFNRTAARTSATALTLAAIALIIPTIFHFEAARLGGWTPGKERQLSLGIASVLLLTYIATLWFSLRTHKQLFVGKGVAEETDRALAGEEVDAKAAPHVSGSVRKSVAILLVATIFVAVISEFLVGA